MDTTKTPKAIDFTIADGKRKGQQAIYKFEGQKLVICYPGEGKGRPTDFDAKTNKDSMLLIYERDK